MLCSVWCFRAERACWTGLRWPGAAPWLSGRCSLSGCMWSLGQVAPHLGTQLLRGVSWEPGSRAARLRRLGLGNGTALPQRYSSDWSSHEAQIQGEVGPDQGVPAIPARTPRILPSGHLWSACLESLTSLVQGAT